MNISFFLAQYLQFRYKSSTKLELYIVDQVHEGNFEIIIRDNADKIEGDELVNADQIISTLDLDAHQKRHQYFHKGYNHLQVELKITEALKPELGSFHSLLSILVLENNKTDFVFSYISPKGEYILDSSSIHNNFSPEELQSKELLHYVNELLRDHFDAIRFTM